MTATPKRRGRPKLPPQPRERDIEAHLVRAVKALDGEVRKVNWIGRRGAPDRFVMLPGGFGGESFWVELKAPRVRVREYQTREHNRMRSMGAKVYVCDSVVSINDMLGLTQREQV